MNEADRMHTIRELVKLTGLSEYFLRKCVRDGSIPFIMCGNRVKCSISMLMDALKAQSVKTANADK